MIDQYPSANGVLTSLIWRKTMSGGETSLSGYDNASQALSYTPGQEQVYLNGILLVRGDDYTATNGTSITGLAALAASDFIQVNCYNNFSVASLPSTSITGEITNSQITSLATSKLTGTIANNQLANSSITINGSAVSLGGSTTIAGGSAQDSEPTSPTEGQLWLDTNGTLATTAFVEKSTISAKGDLYVGTANDTVGILSTTENGATLVADSSQSTGLRYNPQNALANPIINGGFDIWQRGTSISVAASSAVTYLADRWATQTGANQACTISRQATGDTTNLPNIQYCLRFQRNSGQTGTGGMNFATSLETVNTIPFAGKTVTMSFYARKGANYNPGTFNAYIITGTGTDQNRMNGGYTGESSSIVQSITLTTTWTRYVVTGTLGANTNELAAFWFFDFAGTAGANDYFEITGVQIDLGTYTASTAPAFRRSGGTLAGELAACQRYYYQFLNGNNKNMGYGMAVSASAYGLAIKLPVSMRTTPTLVYTTGASYWTAYDGSDDAFDAWAISSSAHTELVSLDGTGNVSATQGTVQNFASNNASAAMGFSAEL